MMIATCNRRSRDSDHTYLTYMYVTMMMNDELESNLQELSIGALLVRFGLHHFRVGGWVFSGAPCCKFLSEPSGRNRLSFRACNCIRLIQKGHIARFVPSWIVNQGIWAVLGLWEVRACRRSA